MASTPCHTTLNQTRLTHPKIWSTSDHGLSGCLLVAGDTIEQFALSDDLLTLDIERAARSHIEKQMHKKGIQKICARPMATPASEKLYVQSGFIRTNDPWIKKL